MKRPLLQVTLLYVLGILLARWTFPLLPFFILAFGLLLAALFWAGARPWLLCPVIVLAGWLNFTGRTAVLSPNDLRRLVGERQVIAKVRGRLRETPLHHIHLRKEIETESATAQIEVAAISERPGSWQPAFGRVISLTRGALPDTFFAGQTVEIDGVLEAPQNALAPGLFDYRSYLKHLGIYYELKVENASAWQIISSPPRPPMADRFCAWARRTLARGLPAQDQILLLEWALTLGWKTALTEEVSEPFVRASTYHIFAVDGLRIAIVSGILLYLFRHAGVPRVYWGLLVMPFLAFYAAMTGWPASAVRAIIMIAVVFGGWVLKRPSDLINSLFAAALVILVGEPRQLFQAGFQLSFFVVLCIILIHPFFDRVGDWLLRKDNLLPDELRPRWQRFLRKLAQFGIDLFLASIAAWLGSIPLVVYYFHLLTPVSGPANVLAVPLCGLTLIFNLWSLLLAWLPFLPELLNWAGWYCMKAIVVTSQWSAHWPAAYYYWPMPSLFTLGLYYLCLLGLLTGWLLKRKRRVWKLSGVGVLVLAWCAFEFEQHSVTEVTILPLNAGSATYLRGPGRANEWLVDCGNDSAVGTIMKPFLRAEGVNGLSNLALTRGESGYSGGVETFVELFRPENIYTSAVLFRSPTYRAFQKSMAGQPAWKAPVQRGDQMGPWTVLHPSAGDHFAKAEDNALVLRGMIDGTRILLLPGLGQLGRRALLATTNDLRADILVAGMSSDGEPLGELLFEAIQPRVVIIADSKDPTPRRVTASFKNWLAQKSVPVIYTRNSDAVTVSLRPNRWELKAMDGTQLSGVPEHPGP